MGLQELEDAILVVKWVYPIIGSCFVAIVSLVIYIWKGNTQRTDDILEKTNKTLNNVTLLVTKHDVKIDNLEKKVFHGN